MSRRGLSSSGFFFECTPPPHGGIYVCVRVCVYVYVFLFLPTALPFLLPAGYNVIHISYIDWRKLRNKTEREEFILKKLKEKNDEFLDENDRVYYNERMNMIKEDYKKFMKEKKESSS